MNVTFITGNQAKADNLAEHLGLKVKHQKVELDEIQSVDLKVIVEHKVRQAYAIVQSPVLVATAATRMAGNSASQAAFKKLHLCTIKIAEYART